MCIYTKKLEWVHYSPGLHETGTLINAVSVSNTTTLRVGRTHIKKARHYIRRL
jgi:hypothetical protein